MCDDHLCVPLHMALTTAKIWKKENSFEKKHLASYVHTGGTGHTAAEWFGILKKNELAKPHINYEVEL